jgi:hypothetical protein
MRWGLVLFCLGCVACNRDASADKAVLAALCSSARDECERVARREDDCYRWGCDDGFRDCIANLDDPPADWQPPDAFTDGCKRRSCDEACNAGSAVACRGSTAIFQA